MKALIGRADARSVALRALANASEADGSAAAAALDRQLGALSLSPAERALATELFYGTLKMQRALRWSLSAFLREPFDRLDQPLRWILLLAAYQLLCLQRIPAHSAVDEAVRLARETGHAGTAALANAVLRKLAQSGRLPPRPPPKPERESPSPAEIESLADYASLPDWIARHICRRFGWPQALPIADGINAAPQRALRLRLSPTAAGGTLRADAGAANALRVLQAAGWQLRLGRFGVPECRIVEKPPRDRHALDGLLASGCIAWQSEESQLAVHLLAPAPGETVLDVCAGRGVKTLMLLDRMRGAGTIYALDDDAAKLRALTAAATAGAYSNVRAIQADARRPYNGDVPAAVDAALVDAPCSALGLIGRRADVRWRKQPGDPGRFAKVQKAIVGQAAQHVKAGGRLLYVTCSTHEAEDEAVVGEFLRANPQWRSSPLDVRAAGASRVGDYCLTAPGIGGADGFFYALLVRNR